MNTGSIGVICPQASPGWGAIADKFFPDYLNGTTFNLTATEAANKALAAKTPTPPADGRTTEDCLFLDVVVPQKVFDSKKGAPVMVWLSGGYTFGDKSEYSGANPAGLLKAGQDEIIYVSFNFRVSRASLSFHMSPRAKIACTPSWALSAGWLALLFNRMVLQMLPCTIRSSLLNGWRTTSTSSVAIPTE